MNHPYRNLPSPESAFREWCDVTACSCCERRAAFARMQRRRLRRVLAVTLLAMFAGWSATALLCESITGRIVAAVEQLNGVALAMKTASHAAPPPPVCDRSPPPAPPPPAPPLEPQWPVGFGILELDATHFVVDRRVIDVILEEQATIMGRPRTVPEPAPGKVAGFRLFGVRPDTFFGHLGFENGDRVDSINGFDLSARNETLEMYAYLRSSDRLFVTVNRRGSKMQLEYRLV